VFRRQKTTREAGHAAEAAEPAADRFGADRSAPARSGADTAPGADEALPLRFDKGHTMASSKTPSPPQRPDLPRRVVDIPGAPAPGGPVAPPRRSAAPTAPTAGGAADAGDPGSTERKLIVGRDISLNGEINACDHLVVEGRVEARLADCKTIEVAAGGTFKGSAEIEQATIGGRFEGDLIVRGRLRLLGDGIVAGTVRYGELEVEAGGRIVGTLEPLESTVTPMPDPASREAAARDPGGREAGPREGAAPSAPAGWQPTGEVEAATPAPADDAR
jgi:cytoskeletal protein CcmA (bactofilin family)